MAKRFAELVLPVAATFFGCGGAAENEPTKAEARFFMDGGPFYTCGIDRDGSVRCWGSPPEGPLGPAPSGSYVSVSTARSYACALDRARVATCWTTADLGSPPPVPPAEPLTQLTASHHDMCGLRPDGTVLCFQPGLVDDAFASVRFERIAMGGGLCGRERNGSITCSVEPAGGTPSSPPAIDVFEGWDDVLVLFEDGSVSGLYSGETHAGPFVSAASGAGFGCGLTRSSAIECWGEMTSPAGEYESLTLGMSHACGLGTDGKLSCWYASNGDAPLAGPPDGFPAR
jgi:hypothetical protein